MFRSVDLDLLFCKCPLTLPLSPSNISSMVRTTLHFLYLMYKMFSWIRKWTLSFSLSLRPFIITHKSQPLLTRFLATINRTFSFVYVAFCEIMSSAKAHGIYGGRGISNRTLNRRADETSIHSLAEWIGCCCCWWHPVPFRGVAVSYKWWRNLWRERSLFVARRNKSQNHDNLQYKMYIK